MLSTLYSDIAEEPAPREDGFQGATASYVLHWMNTRDPLLYTPLPYAKAVQAPPTVPESDTTFLPIERMPLLTTPGMRRNREVVKHVIDADVPTLSATTETVLVRTMMILEELH